MTGRPARTQWVVAGWAAPLVAILTIPALMQPALVFGGLGAIAVLAVTAFRPMVGVGLWLFVLVAIPNWTPTGTGLSPITTVGPLVLLGIWLSRRRTHTKLAWPDIALAAAVVLLGIWVFIDNYPMALLSNIAATLFVSYLIGRVSPTDATRAYLFAMVATALWGIAEFVLQIHVWENWMTSLDHHWNEIQGRAGVARSEAAFGHAIAYGAALSMAIPFAFQLRRFRGTVLAVLLLGIVVSLSRGPIFTAAFTFALVVMFGLRGRARTWGMFGLAVAALGLLAALQFLYGAEDASTTALSGDQRTIQLLATLPHVQWFGSETLEVVGGRIATAGADLIDNTFLRLAVNYGWVMLALILAPLIYAAANVLRARVTPASLALVGQLPVLMVATLITQWQAAVFFIAGIAVTTLIEQRARTQLSAASEANTSTSTKTPVGAL